ncbi:hypothetical protein STCU_09852 [Strigomonas culicis]|uniref:Uncharacterized protein n=1 Tax=Strigomonas culicis TaxID=28005 RepID=S9UVU7_9TRYP|nr:hypothetical protein STCU_09852 [Strigomonas culicis]|eukprot:EPY18621.1 hypothetical protein STCU_09852 [Strigomonas culicis]
MYQDGAYAAQSEQYAYNVATGDGYGTHGGQSATDMGSGDAAEARAGTNYGYADAGASTEMKEGFDAAAAEGGEYYNEYYDPNQYQGYYQDAEGNYYYYPVDPQQEMANETVENAGVAPTPSNLIRSYEYEDWEPKRFHWFVDIVVDTFFSKPFMVYLTILFYCAAVLIATVGLDYTFALTYRMFAPPDPKGNQDLQVFAYLTTFFYLSFILVSAFCALFDMLRNLWWQDREDTVFWGFSHLFLVKRNPPFLIYLIIIVMTVPFPILWCLIETAIKRQSFVFFAQRFANISILVTTFLVVICYAWFFCLAFARKRQSVHYRTQWDDFYLRTRAYKHSPEKMVKTHWYHSSKVLEEFGMDRQTLRYNVIVFIVGCVPLFALYTGTTLSTSTGDPSVTWGAISSLAAIGLFFVAWLTLLHRKGQWSVYIAFVFIGIFLILGVVGGALGDHAQIIGVVIATFIASQGMMTRKRRHALSRKELCATLKVPLNKDIEQRKENKRVDTYLFCCRDLLLDYMKCCDVKTWFGYRHPDVVRAERRYATKKHCLANRSKNAVRVVAYCHVRSRICYCGRQCHELQLHHYGGRSVQHDC